MIHKEKLAKKDKDKSEECSEIDEKKSDDETVKLFLRKISTDKITFDIEYLQVNRDYKRSSIRRKEDYKNLIFNQDFFHPKGMF